MLINTAQATTKNVEFISYTGRYPNLCSGVLTLKIDGKEYKFGNRYSHKDVDYPIFWSSGGSCGFTRNYESDYCNSGEWRIDMNELPDELKAYAAEIDEVFNSNVSYGCCGGCL